MRKARDLLTELTARYPPGDGQSHTMRLNDDGKLEITLFLGAYCQPVAFADESLNLWVRQQLDGIDAVLPNWCKSADLNARKPPDEGEQSCEK